MNLIFRMLWMFATAYIFKWRGKCNAVMGEHRLTYHCLPSDLDFNMHMTNSRYHSFMDLGRVDMMIRSHAWARIRKAGMLPVLGSSSIRFRRAVRLFQRFDVVTKILSWDEKWLYIEHRLILPGNDVASIAVVKAAFLDKDGRVPTDRLIAEMGYKGPRPDFLDVLSKKSELDGLLAA